MILALDVGNTHTVCSIFCDEALIADWRLATDRYGPPIVCRS